MAAELGVTAATIARTLSGLRDRGFVTIRGSHILVSLPSALAALLSRHLGERQMAEASSANCHEGMPGN
jgi:hypothetical protein